MLGCCLQANDPWKVRILPRVAFGVHPAGIDGLTPDAREIVVLHHFLGSWKKRGGWHKRRSVLQILAGAVSTALRRCATLPCCNFLAAHAPCWRGPAGLWACDDGDGERDGIMAPGCSP